MGFFKLECFVEKRSYFDCLYGENLCLLEVSLVYPSYALYPNVSYISSQNLAKRLCEKQSGLARLKGCAAWPGHPFCDGRVTLLAGPTFFFI